MPPIDWTHIIFVVAGAIAQLAYSRLSTMSPVSKPPPTTPLMPSEPELTNLLAAIIHKLVEKQSPPQGPPAS